jgi:hypothetical protein
MRIGELSLVADFDGIVLWRMIDNRPFGRSAVPKVPPRVRPLSLAGW